MACLEGTQPDAGSRRPWRSTTGTWAPTTGTTRSAASRCSASPTPSRSAANAPHWAGAASPGDALRGARPPRRRLLALRRGPAAARTTGSPSTATAAIHLALDEKNNVEGLKRLRHKLQGMLGDLGMHEQHLLDHSIYMHKGMPIGATAHQAGTVRFGTDPASSALDVELQGPRPGQPLRRRHQLLPEHRRGEPVADGDRQRTAGRRPPARTTRHDHDDDADSSDADRTSAAMAADRVDALVIFGATGDLAKLETFPALVGLVERGVLDVPGGRRGQERLGLDQFRDYAAASLTLNGMDPDSAGRHEDARPAALRRRRPRRPGHLQGDVRRDRAAGRRALFYLEVPPFLFGRIAQGIAGGRPGRRRPGDGGEALRHRPGQRPGS